MVIFLTPIYTLVDLPFIMSLLGSMVVRVLCMPSPLVVINCLLGLSSVYFYVMLVCQKGYCHLIRYLANPSLPLMLFSSNLPYITLRTPVSLRFLPALCLCLFHLLCLLRTLFPNFPLALSRCMLVVARRHPPCLMLLLIHHLFLQLLLYLSLFTQIVIFYLRKSIRCSATLSLANSLSYEHLNPSFRMFAISPSTTFVSRSYH